MKSATESLDLIDRIAEGLPVDVRADYYREMRHCRSLPENDEMLRILRIMQFLTLLMEQVPLRVGTERERLEQLVAAVAESSQRMLECSAAYREQIDERLKGLPDEIAEGINPEIIAGKVNESLRQQFVRSTIPETAQALAVISGQMKKVSAEFVEMAGTLGKAYKGAVEDARRSIDRMESSISSAAGTARRAANELSTRFHEEYRWSLYSIASLTLVIGFVFGMIYQQWLHSPAEPVSAPIVQPSGKR